MYTTVKENSRSEIPTTVVTQKEGISWKKLTYMGNESLVPRLPCMPGIIASYTSINVCMNNWSSFYCGCGDRKVVFASAEIVR